MTNPTEDDIIRSIDAGRRRERRIYDKQRWRRMRKIHLAGEPLCRQCGKPATEVDHIIPISVDPAKRWSWFNLQSLCRACHSRKTLGETLGRNVTARPRDEIDPTTGLPAGGDPKWRV
jgi:5-methylcytosine-specific restriction protein A